MLLDLLANDMVRQFPEIKLRNRIVWAFGHGIHFQTRFSGRRENIMWFTKGDEYIFDLDAVRIKQNIPEDGLPKAPARGIERKSY